MLFRNTHFEFWQRVCANLNQAKHLTTVTKTLLKGYVNLI